MAVFCNKCNIIAFLVGLFICHDNIMVGQSKDEIVSSYIKNLTETWNEFNTQTFSSYIIDSTAILKSEPFKIDPKSIADSRTQIQLRLNELQQRINKKELGLHATVSFQENLNSPIVDPEEFVVFKRRAITGLDWDILNNGLYENRLKNKILKLNFETLKKKQLAENLNVFQNAQAAQIIAYFNVKKIEILNARKNVNNKQVPVIEKLWAIKHITKDNYLKAIQNTTDINAQYSVYQNYNMARSSENTFDAELPILDINIHKLLQKANISSFDSSGTDDSRLAKYQSSYLRDVSLKAYTRYNYYDVYNASQPNRSFVSVGMNLSMPLAFNQKDKRSYYLLQQQLSNTNAEMDSIDFEASILNKYYEYQYKLKQFKNLYHRRLVFEELLRTERAKQQLEDLEFNPNTALFILDDYWSNAIELLDMKQDLYKIILELKTKMPSVPVMDYTSPLNLSNLNIASSNPPFKAVYIWSDAFKNNSQTVINEYCKVNEFNPLLISYNPVKGYILQISDFISKNHATPIHLMIGSNKLLQTGITGFLDTLKINMNLSQIKGIHLDIEPHTFTDFKENKEQYFKKYIQLLKQAKQFADNNRLELSVSIPLNYPEEVLSELNVLCKDVYLMAYENVDPDFILKKTAEEKAILKGKCVLALRTKDFENRNAMNEAFQKFGFIRAAFHDLDDLIKFDNQSINVKEGSK